MGWVVMVGGLVGIVAFFLPATSSALGGGSFFDLAKTSAIEWAHPVGLFIAALVGLLAGLGAVGSKAGWYALATGLSGFAMWNSIGTGYGAISGGELGQVGIGLWMSMIGAVLCWLFSIIGAFVESS